MANGIGRDGGMADTWSRRRNLVPLGDDVDPVAAAPSPTRASPPTTPSSVPSRISTRAAAPLWSSAWAAWA